MPPEISHGLKKYGLVIHPSEKQQKAALHSVFFGPYEMLEMHVKIFIFPTQNSLTIDTKYCYVLTLHTD